MTLEKRKLAIIELLKLLKEDCAWCNERHHIDVVVELLSQIPLKSDLYPEDHISKKWKVEHDAMIEKARLKLEED